MEYGDVLEPVAEEPESDRMDATYRAIVETCDRWRVEDDRVEQVEQQLNLPRRIRGRVNSIGTALGRHVYGEDSEGAVEDAGLLAEITVGGTGMLGASYALDRAGTGLAWYGAKVYRSSTAWWADAAEESLIRYADHVRGGRRTDVLEAELEAHPFEAAARAVLWDRTPGS